jgi:hypothetical protein
MIAHEFKVVLQKFLTHEDWENRPQYLTIGLEHHQKVSDVVMPKNDFIRDLLSAEMNNLQFGPHRQH